MIGLLEILKNLLIETKQLNVKELPSQGLFYKNDFSIKIKRAELNDIIEYEHKFDENNPFLSIECIKEIVNKNTILNNGYQYSDIKGIDIIFIFFEIVKFTNKKEIKIPYINKFRNKDFINFNSKHFNYFNFKNYMKYYNKETKEFIINDYKFSLPSIGIDSSLTIYLSEKTDEKEIEFLNNASYDFIFFLNDKNRLSFQEIDNLLNIFNYDLDELEIKKIKKVVDIFKDTSSYSLIMDGNKIEIKSKINLKTIWKN